MQTDASLAAGPSNEQIEEYELPCVEALLAGTLALMTGYAQALRAERDPARRLAFSLRIAHNLERLSAQAGLSVPLRALNGKLALLWQQMARCTVEARCDCAQGARGAATPADRGQRVLH